MAHPSPPASPRHALDVVRIATGCASLAAALAVAALVREDRVAFVALVAIGVLLFSAILIRLGRDVTRRWLAFGEALGFEPRARRPLLDLGTDRPTLHGLAGRHPARLRFVIARAAEGRGREWLEAETDVLAAEPSLAPAIPLVRALERRGLPARASLREGRLTLRAPFDPRLAQELVQGLADIADAMERPA